MADCDAAIALRPNEAWPVFKRGQARYELHQFQVRHPSVPFHSDGNAPFLALVLHAACMHTTHLKVARGIRH